MQLVLLSGGSGTRLWPLSNNARSKQFLPLLEREDGTMESMVQRVVRQVRHARLTEHITVATNVSQRDIVVNQLGEQVSVVTEPERRGTFAAIALATCHLKMVCHCPEDEVVVIMPCDPYTGDGYFQTIARMVDYVRQDIADLVLMGITPTYPSEKYGYVLPLSPVDSDCCMVSRFVEKPTADLAKQFISEGAYWNAGVFAFRLGFMADFVRRYIDSTDFHEIRSRYADFPQAYFDREVLERAESLAMVPYDGEWKDLGTWNTLTDELHRHAIGNVVMGQHCQNTHVINELHTPIFVDGLKDIVVAASPEGVLVCSKRYSEEIKHAVKELTPRPMYEERRWGTYRVLDDTKYADGNHALTKTITLNPGKSISYQIHHHRSEVWTFVEGKGIFVLNGVRQYVKAGDTVIIPVEHYHAIKAISQLTFIEVQNGHPLIEEDIERFDYDWH